eukprot:ctg_190.g153
MWAGRSSVGRLVGRCWRAVDGVRDRSAMRTAAERAMLTGWRTVRTRWGVALGARPVSEVPLAAMAATRLRVEQLGWRRDGLASTTGGQGWGRPMRRYAATSAHPKAAANAEAVQLVSVPTMGESITEGTVVALLKQPGDPVEEDEVVVQLETDKVTVDVRSPAAGVVREVLAAEGDNVEVGAGLFKVEVGAEAAARPRPKPAKESEAAESDDRPAAASMDPPEEPAPTYATPPPPPPDVEKGEEHAEAAAAQLNGGHLWRAPRAHESHASSHRRTIEAGAEHRRHADHLQRMRPVQPGGDALQLQRVVREALRHQTRVHERVRQGGRHRPGGAGRGERADRRQRHCVPRLYRHLGGGEHPHRSHGTGVAWRGEHELCRHRAAAGGLWQTRPRRPNPVGGAARRHLYHIQRRRVRQSAQHTHYQHAAVGHSGHARHPAPSGRGERADRGPAHDVPGALLRPSPHRRPGGGHLSAAHQGAYRRPQTHAGGRVRILNACASVGTPAVCS